MPRVSGYKKQVETNPLEPVRSGVQQDTQALRAAISANQPDGSAAEAQKAITQGGIRRQANAVEIQKAGNKLTEMQGMQGVQLQEQSARLTTMAGRTAAQAIQSSSEILAAMGARLTKIQDDRDTADMFNAVEEWRGYANKYWNDPESGVKATRKMNNASGVYEETRGYMNELETRVGKKLRTDDMKMKFKSAIMGHRESAERDASVWESKQMEAYTAQTTELTINNCIASAAENPTRENFNANFNTAQEALLKSIDGADDTTKALYADTLKSQFHVAIITSQANKDPLKAEKYFNEVRNEILPEARAKLEPEIFKAALYSKAKNLYISVGGDYNRAAKYIAETIPDGEQKQFRAEFASYWSQMNDISEMKYKETNDKLSTVYLKQDNLKGVDLKQLVETGSLDANSAVRWQNIIESDRDRIVARMERDAARSDRIEEKKFREEYKHAVPIEKQYLESEYYYGMPKATLNKNYNDAAKRAGKGELSLMEVVSLVNTGQIIPAQADMLQATVGAIAEKNGRIYQDARSRGKRYIDSIINKLNISEDIKNEIRINYDLVTVSGTYAPEDLNVIAARTIKDRLDQDDIKKRSIFWIKNNSFGFDTDVNDLLEDGLNEIAAKAGTKKEVAITAPVETKVPVKSRQKELNDTLGIIE